MKDRCPALNSPKIQNLTDEIMPARSYSAVFSRWRWVFFFFSFRRLIFLIFFKKEKFNPVAEINRSVSGAIILDRKMPKYFIWEYKKSVEIQDLSL
jgi:hypothetical protein